MLLQIERVSYDQVVNNLAIYLSSTFPKLRVQESKSIHHKGKARTSKLFLSAALLDSSLRLGAKQGEKKGKNCAY